MKISTIWSRFNESIIVILIYFITIFIFYHWNIKDEKLVIGILAVITSIYFGVLKNKTENDKIFNELFKEFNLKYEKYFRRILMEIDNKCNVGDEDYTLDDEQTDQVVQYLNLCAEEYFWYTKGRIPRKVWLSWLTGIKYYLKLPPIKRIVKEESSQKGSYYGFFDSLNIKQ